MIKYYIAKYQDGEIISFDESFRFYTITKGDRLETIARSNCDFKLDYKTVEFESADIYIGRDVFIEFDDYFARLERCCATFIKKDTFDKTKLRYHKKLKATDVVKHPTLNSIVYNVEDNVYGKVIGEHLLITEDKDVYGIGNTNVVIDGDDSLSNLPDAKTSYTHLVKSANDGKVYKTTYNRDFYGYVTDDNNTIGRIAWQSRKHYHNNGYCFVINQNIKRIYIPEDAVICENCGLPKTPDHKCVRFCTDCGHILDDDNPHTRCLNCQIKYVSNSGSHWSKKEVIFEKPQERDTTMHFGVELEVDEYDEGTDYTSCIAQLNKINEKQGWYNPLFYHEPDGSLDDGIETVWSPKTLDWFKNNKELIERVFQVFRDNGYFSDEPSTTGLHIHVDRKTLGEKSNLVGAKIALLVNRLWDSHFMKLSRRKHNQLRYTKKVSVSSDETEDTMYRKVNHDRYVLVNCCPNQTIEFRFWKGTLNYDNFLASIMLTNSIINYCKEKTINELQRCRFSDFYETLSDFEKEYCDRRIN
jgi:hypothetical protein